MKNRIYIVLALVLAVLVGAGGACLLLRAPAEGMGEKGETAKVTVSKQVRKGGVKKITEIKLVENKGKKSVRIVEQSVERPVEAVQDENVEEENLTELQKSVLKELQDALDADDLKRVRKALSKFVAKAEKGGLDGKVPVCLRTKAVEALGWFGKDAAVELLGFVADSNAEVSSDAFTQLEMSLSDCDMSDYTRSAIVSSSLKALTEEEQVHSLLTQLNDMRNSVKAETVRTILVSGTDAAKEALIEQMGDYLEEGIKDQDGVNKWQAEHPDEEGDADLFGGEMKSI